MTLGGGSTTAARAKRVALPQIEALDGLRGLAVLAILLFHAGHLTGGWLGVDVFFVLSGFLITSLLLSEHESTGGISLVGFWGRRARRLLPALLAALSGVCLYAAGVAQEGELARIRADAIATLLYVQNWHAIAAGHDYWEIFRHPSPLDHTWSLAIEEQFYLFWPPLVLFVLARSGGSVGSVLKTAGGLALLSAAWMAACYDPDQGSARVYFGTDTRVAATLVGAVVASRLRSSVRGWPGAPNRAADVAAVIALLALTGASIGLDGAEPFVYRGALFALALASAVVVAGVVLCPAGVTARLLRLHPLRWLGLVSYGAYLWHWPIYLVLSPERVGIVGWSLTGLRIALTLLVSAASYHALEQPIRRRQRLAEHPLRAALIASAALIACLWLATTPATPSDATADQPADPRPALPGAPLPAVDLLLVGDSVAYQLRDAFPKEARARGQHAQVIASEGCGALQSESIRFLGGQVFDLRPCTRFRGEWLNWADRLEPEIVLLLDSWSGEGEKKIDGRWTHPCEADFDAAHARDLGDLVERFAAAGATPVLTLMPPPSVPDLSPNYAHQWGGMTDEALGRLFRERMQCQNRVRAEVAERTGTLLLDLAAEVCPGGTCRRTIDDFTLRPDGMHFQQRGATWAARWLLDQIDAHTPPAPQEPGARR